MNRIFVLLMLPILIIPFVFPILGFINMIIPTGIDLFRIVVYLLLPIIEIAMLAFLILKIKMNLTSKMLAASMLIGFLYLPIAVIVISKLFLPSLELATFDITQQKMSTVAVYKSIIFDSIIVGIMYLGFVTSWFISQYTNRKLFKIIIFVLGGIFISQILSYIAVGIFSSFI